MFCSNCGASLSVQSNFCNGCGAKVSNGVVENAGENQTNSVSRVNGPDQSQVTEKLIGKNASYYMKRWAHPGQRKSWNWASAFLWIVWLGYRKMYKEMTWALIVYYTGITVLEIIGGTFSSIGMNIGIFVYFGLYGNLFYKNHIAKLEQRHLSNPSQYPLDKIGGTSWGGVVLSICAMIVGILISTAITGM